MRTPQTMMIKKGKKKKIILFCDPHQAEAIELSESNGITKCVADIGIVFFSFKKKRQQRIIRLKSAKTVTGG